MTGFNNEFTVIDTIKVTGAGSIDGITLAASAAADNGDGTVKLTCTGAHGLLAGSQVYIEGTTNYDGLRTVIDIPAAATFDIIAPFVAETPAGTETVKVAAVAKKAFKFLGFRLHLSAAVAQADVFKITLDADKGAAWDIVLYSNDLNSETDVEYINSNKDLPFEADDILRFAWPNADSRTFGLEIFVQPLN